MDLPVAIPLVLVVLMTFIYIGAVLNPTAHLNGLPVLVVNEDGGATVNGQMVAEGATVDQGTEQLVGGEFQAETAARHIGQGEDGDGSRRCLCHHRHSGWLHRLAPPGRRRRRPAVSGGSPGQPTVQLLENDRLGSLGVNLAAGVLTPAVQKISSTIGASWLLAHDRGTGVLLLPQHSSATPSALRR